MTRIEFTLKDRPELPQPYHFKGAGLPNIYLRNGVTIERDPDYGEMVTIEGLDGLIDAIGMHVLLSQDDMTPDEFRFLRKRIGLTQAGLAPFLGVSDQTVANYEKGKTPIPRSADTLMRVMYSLERMPDAEYAQLLRTVMKLPVSPESEGRARTRVRSSTSWREAHPGIAA